MNNKIGFFYAIIASFLYGLMSIFTKLATEVSPITLIFFRNFICFMILLPVFLKKETTYKTEKRSLMMFRIIFSFLHLVCFYYAVKNLFFMVDAITLSGTSNLFIPIIIYFFYGIKIPKIRILSVIIGFLGIACILKPEYNFFNFAGIMGLLSGIFLGISKIVLRRLSITEPTYRIIFYLFVGNMIISFFPMVYSWKNFENSIMWVYIFLIGIIAFLFQVLNVKAYTYASATKVSVVCYSTLIFSGFFEWMIYSRMPGILTVIGVSLIIIGGIVSLKDKSKIEKEALT